MKDIYKHLLKDTFSRKIKRMIRAYNNKPADSLTIGVELKECNDCQYFLRCRDCVYYKEKGGDLI